MIYLATKKQKDEISNSEINKINKKNKSISGNLNTLLNKLHTTLYGSEDNDIVDELNDDFNNVLNEELNIIKKKNNRRVHEW